MTSTFLALPLGHWRKRKKDGKAYFIAKPKDSTWADFRQRIKERTRKTLTLGKEEWLNRVNPVIRGKVNYYLTLYKAVQNNKSHGQSSNCYMNGFGRELEAIDGYIRQRLRVAMVHNHPNQKKGHAMKTKWNNEYFARIGLVPAFWVYYTKQFGHSLEDYINRLKEKQKKHQARAVERAKEKGREYYTPDRVRKIQHAQRLATT